MMASGKGHKDVVSILLNHGVNIESQGSNRWTSLMIASQEGHNDIVSLLLSHGANIEAHDHKGWTSLMIASHCRHPEAVSVLLNSGAHIESSLMKTSYSEILSLLSVFERWIERRNFLTFLTQLTQLTQSQSRSPLNRNLNIVTRVMKLEEMKREISYFL